MLAKMLSTALTLAIVTANPALAQNYPNKPIRVFVPVPAGGFVDVVSRRIAAAASPIMGQPWIMDNKAGANFIPVAEACRHAKPDGYSLCIFTTSTVTFNPHLVENLPYNAEKDFSPIVILSMFIGGMVASPKLNIKSVDELKALVLAKPGTMNFGTYGPASSANVFRHHVAEKWNADIVEVPYKGANELLAALASGEIQMTYSALGSWADNPGDTKGRIMVQDTKTRSPKLPEVPIYEEAGLGGFPMATWVGLFAPAGTPDVIPEQINKQVGEAINKPDVTSFLIDRLLEPRVTGVKEFTEYVAREREETGKILRKFNVPKIK